MENDIGSPAPIRKLYRSQVERKIAGVCGGLAEYFNVDPTLMRVVMVVLAVSGPGLLLYPVLWAVVPAPPVPPVAPPAAGGTGPAPVSPEVTDPAA